MMGVQPCVHLTICSQRLRCKHGIGYNEEQVAVRMLLVNMGRQTSSIVANDAKRSGDVHTGSRN